MHNNKMIEAGVRVGRLVTLGPQYKLGDAYVCDCRCDCGKLKTIRANNLRSGATKSCGCLLKELREGAMRSSANQRQPGACSLVAGIAREDQVAAYGP
ncbi:hypothetical protein [Cupriavidus basilensis]|uniref:hypothetical protein n=1 Tax=Cupriavidus basilensis TaxID=68895 RepID=UPI00067FDFB6|nr:hypothetical protein [Cupriavidus basilensis]